MDDLWARYGAACRRGLLLLSRAPLMIYERKSISRKTGSTPFRLIILVSLSLAPLIIHACTGTKETRVYAWDTLTLAVDKTLQNKKKPQPFQLICLYHRLLAAMIDDDWLLSQCNFIIIVLRAVQANLSNSLRSLYYLSQFEAHILIWNFLFHFH